MEHPSPTGPLGKDCCFALTLKFFGAVPKSVQGQGIQCTWMYRPCCALASATPHWNKYYADSHNFKTGPQGDVVTASSLNMAAPLFAGEDHLYDRDVALREAGRAVGEVEAPHSKETVVQAERRCHGAVCVETLAPEI